MVLNIGERASGPAARFAIGLRLNGRNLRLNSRKGVNRLGDVDLTMQALFAV
jgi:hypothetical protein